MQHYSRETKIRKCPGHYFCGLILTSLCLFIYLSKVLIFDHKFSGLQYSASQQMRLQWTNITQDFSFTFVRQYMHDIETARIELVLPSTINQSKFEYLCESTRVQVADAESSDYFDTLNGSKLIKSVFLADSMTNISKQLLSKYFNYGSNDCHMLDKKSGDESVMYKSKKTLCEHNVEMLLKGHPLTKTLLSVGLPNGFQNKTNIQGKKVVTFIQLIRNAIVVEDGDVFADNFHIVPRKCKRKLDQRCVKANQNSPIYDEVFTISQTWGDGFYHSTLEDLPRLAAYMTLLQNHSHIKIHIFQHFRFMDLFNMDSSRFITGTVKAKLLYMPAGTECGTSSLFTTQMLSYVLKRSLFLDSQIKQDTIVLIKRSSKRYFNNHASILSMLKTLAHHANLTVKVFADNPVPGLQATADMFHHAALVVAPHGAGESNMIFSQPGTILIEGLCLENQKVNLCYRAMAKVLGIVYHGLVYKKGCLKIDAEDIRNAIIPYMDNCIFN